MQIGMVGLGRMGANMARRLTQSGHAVVGWDRAPEPRAALAREGIATAEDLAALVAALDAPRAIWVMVPAGDATEATIETLAGLLEPDDIVIDGGNSFFKDGVRRAATLKERGIAFVDVGTSGGVWGVERGYCMMIGGPDAAVARLDPIFASLAPGVGDIARTPGREGEPDAAERGYIHAGPSGAGHFVKMVHNGIEYGLMQAYAEGFDILRGASSAQLPAEQRFDFDLAAIAEVWRRGSVVSSWLLDLTAAALFGDPALEGFQGVVADSGEGRWTIDTALAEAVPANVLSAALYARFRSRQDPSYADKMLSAMRKGFGGHQEPK